MNATMRAYARVLRERWRVVAACGLVTVAAAVALLLLTPSLYRCGFTVFVRTPGDVSRVVDGGDSFAQHRARTYTELARSPDLAGRVVNNLGTGTDPAEFAGHVTATVRPGTTLIDVAVAASSPDEAQRAASAFVTEFSTMVTSLESVPGSMLPRAELVVVDPPGTPTRVTAWGVPAWALLLGALAGGALLGAVVAVLRSIFDRSVRDPRDAARITGLPLLGTIGRAGAATEGARPTWRRVLSRLSDADRGTIAVCEPARGQASAATALAFADILHARGDTAVLVDLDLGSAALTRLVGGTDRAGVADVLLGRGTAATTVWDGPHGPVLTAGRTAGFSDDMVRPADLSVLLDELRERYPWVLLVCPPLLTGARTIETATGSDATVLAVEPGTTTETELHEATQLLPDRSLSGVVWSDVRHSGRPEPVEPDLPDEPELPERTRAR